MKIGFEAKRAFHNHTGLGNYSRQIIQDLNEFYTDNEYYLYTTSFEKNSNPLFRLFRDYPNNHLRTPSGLLSKISEQLWRRKLGLALKKDQLDIFHGLSNELPTGFKDFKGKKIVTIHDVIFKRNPHWYKSTDRKIYDTKTKQACKDADQIIAISNQTKQDLTELYSIDAEKIEVVYQSCSANFYDNENIPFRNEIIDKYKLDKPYILYVGSLTHRKNVMQLLSAFSAIEKKTDHDLILIGDGLLKEPIEQYIIAQSLQQRVRLYTNFPSSDLPPLYQLATCSVYPSSYEGFGIPVIESLWSKTPVIAGNSACLKEAGGPGCLYLENNKPDHIGEYILHLLENKKRCLELSNAGFDFVQKYERAKCTQALFKLYNQ